MTPLRILHVDAGHGWRGGQAQVEMLVRGLAARGHVQALAAPDGPLARRVAAAGHVPTILRFAPRNDFDVIAAVGLARRALAFRPDVIHIHDARAHATGWLAARAAHAACVVTRRVAFAGGARGAHAWKYTRLPVHRFLAISRAVRDELVALGVPAARIDLVPDGVDVAGVRSDVEAARAGGRRDALRGAWGATRGEAVVGVIAALTPEKGHATLVGALARLDPADRARLRLVAVGDGPLAPALAAQARERGIADRVTWAGASEDIAGPLAAFDALAMPSLAEGFGSIALAAQVAGVPVFASAVGGLVDAIADGETGRLLPAADEAAWAAALAAWVRAPEAAAAWAARARETVRRHDLAATAAATEEAYRRARQPDAAS